MKRARFRSIAALAAALLLRARASGAASPPGFDLGGFLIYPEQDMASANIYGQNMDAIYVYDYNFDDQYNLVPATNWVTNTLAQLHQNPIPGRKILITVVNEYRDHPGDTYSVNLLSTILTDPVKRAQHIQQLVQLSQQADGIDIDYELLRYENGYVDLSNALTEFFKELRAALPPDKLLTADFIWKTTDTPGEDALAYDWRAVAPFVDQFHVMIYNYHGAWNGPGPDAPLWLIQDVASFAVGTDGVPLSKLHVVNNTFMWDWDLADSTKNRKITYHEAMIHLSTPGATSHRDAASQCLVIDYKDSNGQAHEIWAEDRITYQAKIQAAQASGVKHFDFFSLSDGDPAGWQWLAETVSGGAPLAFQVTPDIAAVGAPGLPITVEGANFAPGAAVQWNGQPRATVWQSSTSLQATLTASDLSELSQSGVSVVSAGQNTATLPFTVNATAFSALRINCGGHDYVDDSGDLWSEDTNYSGGFTNATEIPIAGTSAPTLYRGQRWSSQPLVYQFSVPNGSYDVTLLFAETYFNAPGKRLFNVAIGTATVLSQLDIEATAGFAAAYNRTFTTNVTNGLLKITFTQGAANNPTVAGIQILATPRPAPEIAAIAPSSVTVGGAAFSMALTGENFETHSVASWNGSQRPTTFIDSGHLSIAISSQDIAAVGVASVTVRNRDTVVISNAAHFVVAAILPPPNAPGSGGGAGGALSSSLDGARAYPNPWRADRNSGGIIFDELPQNTSIKIFTLAGQWVGSLGAPSGSATWDLRNHAGQSVASGYYFYLLEDPQGNKSRGKIMIIH